MGQTKRFFGILGTAAALAMGACANDRGPYPNLPTMGVFSEFKSRNLCGLGESPEIKLGAVPPNTATYRLLISQVSTLRGGRWQADIPASGPGIAEGALNGFDLPCPADKQVLTYRLEVMALAADARPLGYGWGFSSAISLPEQIEIEQRLAKRPPQPAVAVPTRSPSFFIY